MKQGKAKIPKMSHVAGVSKGMGDYYGTGVRNKTAKMVRGMGRIESSPSKLGKDPKSLA